MNSLTKLINHNDIVYYKTINLDWDQVATDLETIKTDTEYEVSVVSEQQYHGDDLYALQNEYAKYGYTSHNTKIWKTTGKEPKITFDWEADICKELPLDHAIATVTRQDPGQILPWHPDRFFMLRNRHPNDTRPIYRFLMFLEDWKMGHVLQFGDTVLHHWKRGDVYIWDPKMEHVSANIGLETKWTCNITGFLVG